MSQIIDAIKESFFECLKFARGNGLWLLQKKNSSTFQRCLIFGVLLGVMFFGIYLSFVLWLKFYSSPTTVTAAPNIPSVQIIFPGITICSPHTIIREKLDHFLRTSKLPKNHTIDDIRLSIETISVFARPLFQPINKTLFQIADDVLTLNNLTVVDALYHIGLSCGEFLERCYWALLEFPCYQKHAFLTFKNTTSFLGMCCSFNHQPNEKLYIPFSSNTYGFNGGLILVGNILYNRTMYSPGEVASNGLMLFVHHPNDFTTESAPMVTLKSNVESYVVVLSHSLNITEEVSNLKTQKRNCLTSFELNTSPLYRQLRCKAHCQADLIYKTCNCHPYSLTYRGSKSLRNCTMKDAECFALNLSKFTNEKCTNCLPNCADITYKAASYTIAIKDIQTSEVNLYLSKNSSASFIVRIFMSNQVVSARKKVVAMSWINLIANVGGTFNLCLGLSIISVTEFTYFFVIWLYKKCIINKKPIILVRPNKKN